VNLRPADVDELSRRGKRSVYALRSPGCEECEACDDEYEENDQRDDGRDHV